jgi:hypothetical protein
MSGWISGDKKPNVVRRPELNLSNVERGYTTTFDNRQFEHPEAYQKYTHVIVHQASQIFNWNHGDRHRKLGTRRKQKQQKVRAPNFQNAR